MTIFILDEDQKKCAKYLDDKSLENMIKDIAHILRNIWDIESPLLKHNFSSIDNLYHFDKWSLWGRECKANYLYLVELGNYLIEEYLHRFKRHTKKFNKQDKYFRIFIWAINNIPDLPLHKFEKCILNKDVIVSGGLLGNQHGDIPLLMPLKYLSTVNDSSGRYKETNVIQSYRNYYNEKLKQKLLKKHPCDNMNVLWTKRQKPDWILC